MNYASVCSGIGGIDLGLDRAGMNCVLQCENNRDALKVLERHWPDVPKHHDLTTLTSKDLDGAAVQLVCGGTPCTDLSVAGNRAGLAGHESRLFFDFVRFVDECSPPWILWENVPGLLSSNGGRDMGIVLGTLADLGYGFAYRVLNSEYFGVPQRRRRVLIVGCLGDPARAAQVLFEPESCEGDSPPRRDTGARVAALTANSVGTCGADDNQGQAGHLIPTGYSETGKGWWTESGEAGTLSARDYKSPTQLLGFHLTQDPISGEITPAMGARDQATLGVSYEEPFTFDWQAGGTADKTWRGKSRQWIDDPPGRTRAIVANKTLAVAYGVSENQRGETLETLETMHQLSSGGGKPGQGYPAIRTGMQVRRLTPLECSRLQSFPDDWLEISDADATQAYAREVLHCLWRATGTEAAERGQAGGPLPLLTPEVLLAGVYGGWVSWEMAARCAAQSRALPSADAWPEGFVRELWVCAQRRPTSHRRESFEQLARELGRPLSQLPLEDAQARQALLDSPLWSEASTQWPMRHARPEAQGWPSPGLSDSAKYRLLSNAVTVNVAHWIGLRMMAS